MHGLEEEIERSVERYARLPLCIGAFDCGISPVSSVAFVGTGRAIVVGLDVVGEGVEYVVRWQHHSTLFEVGLVFAVGALSHCASRRRLSLSRYPPAPLATFTPEHHRFSPKALADAVVRRSTQRRRGGDDEGFDERTGVWRRTGEEVVEWRRGKYGNGRYGYRE